LTENLATFGPTSDEAAALAEAFEHRLAALPDEVLRAVALKKLEGFSNREIAQQLGCAERSVERKLNLIRHLWERDADEDEPRA
jgi:DNA-directed RNA polymerase specialized sigma24 family protein